MLADSLSMTDADSSLVILNELDAEVADWKESDRLYFNQIRCRARAGLYLLENPGDSLQRALLQEQERVLKASARRSGKYAATIMAVLLGLLLMLGLLVLRTAVLQKDSEQTHRRRWLLWEKSMDHIAASPEVMTPA